MEAWAHYTLMKQLLCVRHPREPLDPALLQDIEQVLLDERAQRVLIDATSLPALTPATTLPATLHLWQGDITTLDGVTAITNAANSEMLGCFQPAHRCIDNIIHARAGPRLREACFRLMKRGKRQLPVGQACTTQGYCLPASYIIHTVGPQLDAGQSAPTSQQRHQLQQCYEAILDAAETLPLSDPQGKTIALCGISTGLFAFPVEDAAPLAVAAVINWLQRHPDTTITNIIFNTFRDADTATYQQILTKTYAPVPSLPTPPQVHSPSLHQAKAWLRAADTILVSCGAGISAAIGLDYTSTTLFTQHFPAFKKYRMRRLYDCFDRTLRDWPSENVRWGFYFTQMAMVRNWPRSPLYTSLIEYLGSNFAPDRVHVRTSNADGQFRAHDLPEEQLSTPQGQYAYLQCLEDCHPDAVVPSAPYLEAALPYLDPVTQVLTDSDKVPTCAFCGGAMFLCVRGGDWFNERPFAAGEERWHDFRETFLTDRHRNVVILELGVGLSTPGVLRWENEELVEQGEGRVRLVRAGLGDAAHVPWELEAEQLATTVEGDLQDIVRAIVAP
ncbi:ganglioside induced differentiation associated protein [Aspergillus ibericus CBS 121593]|uniref:Ganglioside induced differentiation associated protein n=1 Tax=Aspergillus ibericus CBS 121593 TaxID=1448316 RepID=A0A395GSI2_9EURO|nr:ganglioside induced differentiation associated protein [Aspergillus ibericus CBS 121593]RAK98541.1 ganglioside induced differentiation associated protein [Aspergillus ibericus CBS 121593]